MLYLVSNQVPRGEKGSLAAGQGQQPTHRVSIAGAAEVSIPEDDRRRGIWKGEWHTLHVGGLSAWRYWRRTASRFAVDGLSNCFDVLCAVEPLSPTPGSKGPGADCTIGPDYNTTKRCAIACWPAMIRRSKRPGPAWSTDGNKPGKRGGAYTATVSLAKHRGHSPSAWGPPASRALHLAFPNLTACARAHCSRPTSNVVAPRPLATACSLELLPQRWLGWILKLQWRTALLG